MTQTNEQTWTVVSLQVPEGESDEVADWMREALGIEPVLISRPHTPHAWVEAYFTGATEALIAQRALMRQYPDHPCVIRGCEARDWQQFWRGHFTTRLIGERLQIVPVWETPPANDRITLRLDPGLSFGTGDHFTTRFCLEQLDRIYAQEQPESMLDAGTGSGILAIAAEKLGARRIEAFDFDPLCLEYAQKNLELNGACRVHLFEHDITRGVPNGPCHVVCANIFSRLLIASAPGLVRASSRWLILTGILQHESDDVSTAFLKQGARETTWDGDGEWCGMVFRCDG